MFKKRERSISYKLENFAVEEKLYDLHMQQELNFYVRSNICLF